MKRKNTFLVLFTLAIMLGLLFFRALSGSAARPVAVGEQAGGANNAGLWVTGYYVAYYHELYPPDKVDMSALTHFVFGNAVPGNGANFPVGEVRFWVGDGEATCQPLVDRAHAAGKKALLMVGGANTGAGFDASTANPTLRANFIENILDLMEQYDFDGVDIDWEENLDTADQRNRLIALLSELRAAAGQRARYQAPNAAVLITYPTFTVNTNFPLSLPKDEWLVTVASLVDQFNLMTYGYGMTGAWSGWVTWHHSPLSGEQSNHPTSIASSIAAYAQLGIPQSKIGMGIGFYGINYLPHPAWQPNHAYSAGEIILQANGLHNYRCTQAGTSAPSGSGPTGTQADIADGSVRWEYVADLGPRQPLDTMAGLQSDDNQWMYRNIAARYLTHGVKHWDDAAKQSYLLFPGGYTPPSSGGQSFSTAGFLSYEDEKSIAAKGQWAKQNGIGGTIIWAINHGCMDTNTGANPLLDAVKAAFLSTVPVPTPDPSLTEHSYLPLVVRLR